MKILFALNKDIFSVIALNMLIPFLEKNGITFSLMITDKIGAVNAPVSALKPIEQIFAFEKIFPIVNEYQIIGQYLTYERIREKYHADIHYVKTVNNDFGKQTLAEHDLTVSIRFGSIFKDDVIRCAPNGIYNLHSAILPDYRGVLGVFRALVDKKERIGATLHRISDNGIDTGEIVAVKMCKADYKTTLFRNIFGLYQHTVPLIEDLLETKLQNKPIAVIPQKSGAGAYFSSPTPEEFVQFAGNIMPLYNNDDLKLIAGLFIA
jgi:methionyl-tRNA formyltransferase